MGDPCGGSSALVDFIEIDHRGVSMVELFYEWPLEYGEVAVDIVEGIGSANGVFQEQRIFFSPVASQALLFML